MSNVCAIVKSLAGINRLRTETKMKNETPLISPVETRVPPTDEEGILPDNVVASINQEDIGPVLQGLDAWFRSQQINVMDQIFLSASFAGALIGWNANPAVPEAVGLMIQNTARVVHDTAIANEREIPKTGPTLVVDNDIQPVPPTAGKSA